MLSAQFLGATPILNCNNLDVTITCQTLLSETPTPSVSTDCGSTTDVRISFEDDRSRMDACGHQGVLIRTWIAIDSCGAVATCSQVITITNEAPVLVCNNLNVTIGCADDLFEVPQPTVSDDCSPTNQIQLTSVDDYSGLSDCGDEGTILRTWRATDACGQTATCVQTITIRNQAPVLTCDNLDVTIACDVPSGLRTK